MFKTLSTKTGRTKRSVSCFWPVGFFFLSLEPKSFDIGHFQKHYFYAVMQTKIQGLIYIYVYIFCIISHMRKLNWTLG